jgi:hypothetical protein
MSLRSTLILSSNLRLCLPSGLFRSGFPTKTLYIFLFSPCVLHALLISFSPLLIIHTIFGEEYKLSSSSLCSFLQPPVTSSLFCPNILLITLFSNTLSICSSFNVRDQVSHPYKTIVVHTQQCSKFTFRSKLFIGCSANEIRSW